MLNFVVGPPQLFHPKKNVQPAGDTTVGVPSHARKTTSRSPVFTTEGIETACDVESVGNDVSVMPCTIVAGPPGGAGPLNWKNPHARSPTKPMTRAAATYFVPPRFPAAWGSAASAGGAVTSAGAAASSKFSPHNGHFVPSASTVDPHVPPSYTSTVPRGACPPPRQSGGPPDSLPEGLDGGP